MAPMVERREHPREYPSDRSMSPVTNRHSPRGKSSPRRERSTVHHRGSPRARSLQRTCSSHKERSPAREKLPDWASSPKQSRHRSPVRTSTSRSPSPRTKRLKRAQAEREEEKLMDRDRGRSSGREERSKRRQREHREKDRASSPSLSPRSKRLARAQTERGAAKIVEQEHGRDTRREERNKERHGEHGNLRDAPSDRKPVWEKSDGRSSRSSRHDRSVSPEEHNHRSKHGSHSPPRGSRAGTRDEATKPRAADQLSDGDVDSVAKMKAAEEYLEAKDKDKQKPSFELSGKLAEETNRYRGVTLLFNEPADACKPDIRWRLYVFKSGEVLNEPLYVHRQSCYLFGRERRVADIPTDHPSCSKQHAVIHYRLVEKEQPDGLLAKQSGICDIARELYWMSNFVSKQKNSQKHQEWIPAICVILPMLLLSTRQLLVDPSIEQLVVLRDDLVPTLAVWPSFAPSQGPLVGRSSMRDLLCTSLLIFRRSVLIVVQYIMLPQYVSLAAYEEILDFYCCSSEYGLSLYCSVHCNCCSYPAAGK